MEHAFIQGLKLRFGENHCRHSRKVRSKLIHAMKARRKSGGLIPLILKNCLTCRRVVKLTPQPVTTEHEDE
jgi:hypothetical protein